MGAARNLIEIRTTSVHYPRDGELAAAVIDGALRVAARVQRAFAAARREREAQHALRCMDDRMLRDVGLTRDRLRQLVGD